jgi:phosphatidylserine decarboxylase
MRRSSFVHRVCQHDGLNFILTNRIPRRLATRFMGWFSRIEQSAVRDLSMAVWRFFAPDLDLDEAKETSFRSLHDCFVRELKDGARPIDRRASVIVSPCDGIVGASGQIAGATLIQAKGSTYTLDELLCERRLARDYRNGTFVTLRLTSTMYHHFHAPDDGDVDGVTYVAGDAWNVNPPALKRVRGLFCRNERAIVRLDLRLGESLTLVPVAAILVASIRFTFLDTVRSMKAGAARFIPCRASFRKGERMGHFHHGSTMIVIGTPGLELCETLREGMTLRVGQPLLRYRVQPETADTAAAAADFPRGQCPIVDARDVVGDALL